MAAPIAESAALRPAVVPKPFVKWVGGKRSLMAQLEPLMPTDYERYLEPFVGGGAMFFHLQPENARISDVNWRLIETYRTVRDDLPGLIDRLESHRARYDRCGSDEARAEYYYAQRDRFNARRTDSLDRAALFIFLNRMTFNGLFRENKSGGFNAPWGQKAKAPAMYNLETLSACARALEGVEIANAGFESVLDTAQAGDFVYFDPPYVPLDATKSFVGYAKKGFDAAMQIDLAKTFDILARRGCYVMLSNSDCEAVHELYAGWRIETVYARRAINRDGDGRGEVSEVVVCSW